ncbi:MAG: penicillin-binding protein 2 [Nitrospirota bacterium]
MFHEVSPTALLRRLPLLAGLIVLLALILLIRLWYLQAVKGDYYYEQAESNRIRPVKIRPPRGVIYDRNGRPIVENVLTFDISLVPEDASNLDETIGKLSSIVKIDRASIREMLEDVSSVRTRYEPVKIKEEVPWDLVSIVESHQDDLPGAIVEPVHRRHYPYGSLASHQLGYIGKVSQSQRKQSKVDLGLLVGQSGLEKMHDKLLRGAAGRRMIQVNAAGRKVKDLGIEEPRLGKDIYLTLDLDVQQAAEEALGSRAGSVVAMDPNTGEIIAMVSHPNYDPNLFPRGITPRDWDRLTKDPSHPLYNRAIQSVYPPGSTFKIVVALAGLDSGIIKPNDKVPCNGFIKSGKHIFRCWKRHGHGVVSLHQAIVESCDVYFYTMAERIGFDRIAEYARKLGLGTITGIQLQDEKAGLIPTSAWKKKRTKEQWYAGDSYINGIGQGFVLVSPMQAAQMISAVANGGRLFRPILLQKMRDRETKDFKVFSSEQKEEYHFNAEALEAVRKALAGVVSEPGGTGHAAGNPVATVAGKTGTAQVIAQKIPGKKLVGKTQDHAWFVAYAPVEKPKIAVAVVVEHGGHGGSAAAPVARRVIEEYLKNAESK